MDNFINILNRLREIMRVKTQRDIARSLGMSEQHLSDIKRAAEGKPRPGGATGIPFERIIDWSVKQDADLNYILTGKRQENRSLISRIDPPEIVVNMTNRTRLVADAIGQGQYLAVPLLKDAVAAGPPTEVRDDAIDGFCLIYASRDWMPHNSDAYTCVYVRGRSMWPILDDGDIVAIDHAEKPTSIDDLKYLDGKMCAFRVDGGVTIKWLKYIVKSQTVIGVPQNIEEALDHTVSLQYDEIDEGIIGTVRWWWSKR